MTDPDGNFAIFGAIGIFKLIKILGIVRAVAPIFINGNNFQATRVNPDRNWELIRLAEIAAWGAAIAAQEEKEGKPYKLVVVGDCYLQGGSRAAGDLGLAPSVARKRTYTLVDINNNPVRGVDVREINHVYGQNGLHAGNSTFDTYGGATFDDIITTDRAVTQDQQFVAADGTKLIIEEMDRRTRHGTLGIYSDRNWVVINGDWGTTNGRQDGEKKFCP